ncbi:MAG: radical SAM family heme chaperone HemW [Gammaproteobacteria bacterium]|nr:radical SAM family heme chaperone HemW [Gammaproteobacteria bacterium]
MSAPAGLYIHIPFCSAVCPYCDFAVRVAAVPVRARFVKALVREIELWRNHWHFPIDTVYFGGGTPSLLSGGELSDILGAAMECLPVRAAPTIFFEANPEDVDETSLALWQRLAVSYLSLGVQSLVDAELRFLGRRHCAHEAVDALVSSMEAGFTTVSADIIFGLPGQTGATLAASLDRLMKIGPPHVSCYQLTLHEGTTFGRWHAHGKLTELPETVQARYFELVQERLAQAGYDAYEVSNFASAPGHRSAHNMKYWSHAPYLGLGPSSHSFDGRSRWWNESRLSAYEQALANGRPIAAAERLTDEQLALEALMLKLRTAEGIEFAEFYRRYGVDLAGINGALCALLAQEGLALIECGRMQLTRQGLAVADGIAARFALE